MQELDVITQDGASLRVRRFDPMADPRASLVISPAMAVPQRFYQAIAEYFRSLGWQVWTFDYRGIGLSRRGSLKGYRASVQEWAEQDLEAVLASTPEDIPLLVLGHSLGGQLLGLAPSNHRVRAFLSVGSQSGYWRNFAVREQLLFALLFHALLPGVTRTLGYFPAKRLRLGEDVPGEALLQWARWCRHPNYLMSDVTLGGRENFRRYDGPLLALSFTDDPWAPYRAVQALFQYYERARLEIRRVSPGDFGLLTIGHFGLFRKQSQAAWKLLAEWFSQYLE